MSLTRPVISNRVAPQNRCSSRAFVSACRSARTSGPIPDLDGRSIYHRDPVLEQVEAGAQLLVNISASPFELGKAAQRRDLVRRYAAQSGRFFVYANQVGGNDELVFDGHSIVVDPTGRVVVRGHDFAERSFGLRRRSRAVIG